MLTKRRGVTMVDDNQALDLWLELFRSHHDRVQKEPQKDFTAELIEQLSAAGEPERRRALTALILHEAQRCGNQAVYKAVGARGLEEFPDDTILRINRASYYLYSLAQPDKALEFIEDALSVARRVRHFRRHALATRARIALALGNRNLWEQTLQEIMQLKFEVGDKDIGREADIVEHAPPEYQEANVAKEYLNFCRSQKKNTPIDS